jgi:hypothetical protein
MTPKSTAERMRELRERMRESGFKLLQVWVHPADEAKVRALVERLMARRQKRS